MEIKSPVTYSSNITRIRSFDVEKIKALYLEETGLMYPVLTGLQKLNCTGVMIPATGFIFLYHLWR
ncbi:MAG: hypothetical protein IPO42_10775 [Chitinophagaceae bacterium]|nr:hypothetical protein [Chitinophagaceae bacterium]